MAKYSFGPEHRLKSARDFSHVYDHDVHAADDVLVLRGWHAESSSPRLGVSVSRRVGNAVVRNRWKRRIREAFRLCRHLLPPIDIVVRPRKGAAPDFHAIARSLPQLVERLQRKLQRSQTAPSRSANQKGPPRV